MRFLRTKRINKIVSSGPILVPNDNGEVLQDIMINPVHIVAIVPNDRKDQCVLETTNWETPMTIQMSMDALEEWLIKHG